MVDFSQFTNIPKANQLSLKCANADSFEEFVCFVYELIDKAIIRLERQANVQFLPDGVEDGWSSKLIDNLDGRGVVAAPVKFGGNTDITIVQDGGDFFMICESKLLGQKLDSTTKYNNDHLLEGVLQLVTRYATASVEMDHCVLVIFCLDENMRDKIDNWWIYFKDKYTDPRFEDQIKDLKSVDYEGHPTRRGFYTQHLHGASGYPVIIRHIPVCLHHNPVDKSARKSKKKAGN